MSTSIAAQSNAARKSKKLSDKKSSRKSARKASSQNLFGAAAVGCLVLGAGWTVYSNIFSASVYPTLGAAG